LAKQNDDNPRGPGDSTREAGPSPDDEASADLSRAAREAVRQPADPRLEKQFAYLGLWGETEPSRRASAEGAGGAATDDAEAARQREALAALVASTTALEGRLDGMMRLLAIVVRMLAVLTVIVLGLVILVVAQSVT
jgi:hypothetical protein